MDRILSTFVLLNTSTVLKDFIERSGRTHPHRRSHTLSKMFQTVQSCCSCDSKQTASFFLCLGERMRSDFFET